MNVIVRTGNLFDSKAQALVNPVNCVGVMGKGLAKEFKIRFPEMFRDYADRCRRNEVFPGRPYLYRDLRGTFIVNFPTKNHWKSASRIEDIRDGLLYFIGRYEEWGILSAAFPALGCGNGGLEWDTVGPLMFQLLSQAKIPIEIYAPFGTPEYKLTYPFLCQK